MIRCTRPYILCLISLPLCLAGLESSSGEAISPPKYSQRIGVAITPRRSGEIEAEIEGAKELLLVVSGARWGWANWVEPRLIGPAGELRLTDLNWKFASSGYGRAQVNANAAGDPQRINGAAVAYGIGVHDPSLLIYDLPPGYTHFRARAALDDGGRGPVTFMVYADCPFFDRRNPGLWQREVGREQRGEPAAFVETVGGDRLPGEVIAAGGASDVAFPAVPYLLVQATSAVNYPDSNQRPLVRVIERFVQRVVWQAAAAQAVPCPPGSARLRNGGTLRFRSARFAENGVKLLESRGIQTIAFEDLAEIHLPNRDPWEAYCDELAVLSPGVAVPLVHVQLDRGVAVTASRARLRYLPPQHHDSEPMKWHLGVQPAWSLDMLWLSETDMIARSEYPPDRPSLVRLRPTVDVQGGLGDTAWLPRKNHNVRGLELAVGGQHFGWGFGVQAPNELHFELPEFAEGFRTRVGLDALAGGGGCALARVIVGSAHRRLLWESPLLIGSSQSFDSGLLPLRWQDVSPGRLVLQAHEAHDERPPGADPFEIRDLVNWLDPELALQSARLRAAVEAQLVRWVPAWENWQIAADRDSTPQLVNWWDADGEGAPRFAVAVASGNRLTLTRQVLHNDLQQLRIVAAVPPRLAAEAAEIEVLLDGAPVFRGPIPVRRADQHLPPPILVPLATSSGDPGHHAALSVVLHAADHQPLIEWFQLDLL